MGEAGIGTLGYNFSLPGVSGRVRGPYARGGAISVGMEGPVDSPIPNGTIWNMIYDTMRPPASCPPSRMKNSGAACSDSSKRSCLLPNKQACASAAHPDDPPLPMLRQQPRLVYQQALYQRLLDLSPSPSNMLEFCLGTLAEMHGRQSLRNSRSVQQPEAHCLHSLSQRAWQGALLPRDLYRRRRSRHAAHLIHSLQEQI